MDKVSFGVADMHCRPPAAPDYWDVDFAVFGRGMRGHVIVPVPCGICSGENVLRFARNNIRVFSGHLADATAAYALTDGRIVRLRKGYQPDPLLR